MNTPLTDRIDELEAENKALWAAMPDAALLRKAADIIDDEGFDDEAELLQEKASQIEALEKRET